MGNKISSIFHRLIEGLPDFKSVFWQVSKVRYYYFA